ncbi:MAG: M23 family metallopeptidase, partial [Oscillospiraceae bacterium]|nr:M23 family metallopeptidase [Oscillospiraceae bacterium]
HDGIDITCDLGTQVIATAAGTVVSVENDDLYGTTVEIDHANGIHSIYANLASEPPVSVGDTVTMGQVIGSVGSTAICETNQVNHLHFAMTCDGLPADPTAYLPAA